MLSSPTTSRPETRQLLARDIEALFAMALVYSGGAVNLYHFQRAVLRLMRSPEAIFVGRFEAKSGRMTATAAGVVNPDLFTGEPTLYGLWWFAWEHRARAHDALRVLRELWRVAAAAGAVRAEMGVDAHGNERVASVYGRMGLRPATVTMRGAI